MSRTLSRLIEVVGETDDATVAACSRLHRARDLAQLLDGVQARQ